MLERLAQICPHVPVRGERFDPGGKRRAVEYDATRWRLREHRDRDEDRREQREDQPRKAERSHRLSISRSSFAVISRFTSERVRFSLSMSEAKRDICSSVFALETSIEPSRLKM